MLSSIAQVFLGRQPIVDRYRQVIAYELLFRPMPETMAQATDNALATDSVIRLAFNPSHSANIVGACRAFINVGARTLFSTAIEALSPARVVVELLESIRVDDNVLHRCRELKAKGYVLALDDFTELREDYEPLLDIVDIVKVDIPMLSAVSLAQLVQRLRRWSVQLLAEKVETRDRAAECQALGFDFFQGFFFGRPKVLTLWDMVP
jgi:c-di-GMP-related signal transduction protein